MKALLLAIFSLCFVATVAALSPAATNQTQRKTRAIAGVRLTTIMGTVEEDGDKLRFVTDLGPEGKSRFPVHLDETKRPGLIVEGRVKFAFGVRT